MKLYFTPSLDAVAEHFERRAETERNQICPEASKSRNKGFSDRAAVWTEAANILRQTELTGEPKV